MPSNPHEARARELLNNLARIDYGDDEINKPLEWQTVVEAFTAVASESRRAALEDAAQAADLMLGATMAQSSVGKAIRALAKVEPNG